ncbi:hypothetical protein [Arcobacter sp. YIC-310]|uniref:hypothetical protein n=1 Tax=Arcobacter sp. YIC-310 TaxID=3376632 RepID=UPI003C22BDA0
MTTQYDITQINVIKEHLFLIIEDKIEKDEETLKRLFPHYAKKIDDNSFIFMNKYNEVIAYYKDNFCIKINQYYDKNYYKNLENFKSYSVNGFINNDIFFYDEQTSIWKNKKNLDKYSIRLSNFINFFTVI